MKKICSRIGYSTQLTNMFCENYCTSSRFKPLIMIGLGTSKPFVKKLFRRDRDRPRYYDLTGQEDWTNLWPSAKSFIGNSSLLPIRQGYIKNSMENEGIKPEKYGNLELMKIPNFLHLTPVHIKKHCDAIKKFCTKWPEELNDDSMKQHFPFEFSRSDYIHSAPSIRDIRARIVTLKFDLSILQLDDREKFKFISLVGSDRYDKSTNTITIIADRCPSHRQNYDYLVYVLTALISESKKFEQWELKSEESDWVKYRWEESKFKANVDSYLEKAQINRDSMENLAQIEAKLKSSIETIYDEKETVEMWNQYKNGVIDLFKLENK